MAILELVRTRPDWYSALEAALTRPEGVPERRQGEDPWAPPRFDRPRRVSDDLAWLRQAMDSPEEHGLKAVDEDGRLPIWECPADDRQTTAKLERLRSRGILDAAGFLLHQPQQAGSAAPSGSP
jgi:hypothetical protein